mmetsp:Transcript_30012/g.50409  ORF Transcript_30012/g.50409 Transcript_30012/m.50409 type:complete len:584 (-) Transcript_30012:24-1775(-)|eukprot:CAMPEP_0184350982 /NCGR_PEP_ID=MMETSP1089-20130417/43293_1 /TAXON_ID=38269 ORGANISM="Gloeochaete wittrockiana, Strain SAG46.84" /NCGR_SAMPLE_ID=MMETSP1089 /ASSEMBLY_ACC=CAM_ASM_000445 /LENGTH=583 /DNA_ID=CAMNT_0026684131 /DNA_START=146 /DNA_END=1897 /DNA_ORIENTATION=+
MAADSKTTGGGLSSTYCNVRDASSLEGVREALGISKKFAFKGVSRWMSALDEVIEESFTDPDKAAGDRVRGAVAYLMQDLAKDSTTALQMVTAGLDKAIIKILTRKWSDVATQAALAFTLKRSVDGSHEERALIAKKIIPVLADYYLHPDHPAAEVALAIIGRFGPLMQLTVVEPITIKKIAPMLKSKSAVVRTQASGILAFLNRSQESFKDDEDSLNLLIETLTDPDENVRRASFCALVAPSLTSRTNGLGRIQKPSGTGFTDALQKVLTNTESGPLMKVLELMTKPDSYIKWTIRAQAEFVEFMKEATQPKRDLAHICTQVSALAQKHEDGIVDGILKEDGKEIIRLSEGLSRCAEAAKAKDSHSVDAAIVEVAAASLTGDHTALNRVFDQFKDSNNAYLAYHRALADPVNTLASLNNALTKNPTGYIEATLHHMIGQVMVYGAANQDETPELRKQRWEEGTEHLLKALKLTPDDHVRRKEIAEEALLASLVTFGPGEQNVARFKGLCNDYKDAWTVFDAVWRPMGYSHSSQLGWWVTKHEKVLLKRMRAKTGKQVVQSHVTIAMLIALIAVVISVFYFKQ